MTRSDPRPRAPRAPRPAGGWRLPFDVAPAVSAIGLVVVAVVTLALFGGSIPVPGGDGGPGPGVIRTPTPSNVVVVPDDPRADVPGSLLYAKGGNIWVQSGDTARQLTSSGADS